MGIREREGGGVHGSSREDAAIVPWYNVYKWNIS